MVQPAHQLGEVRVQVERARLVHHPAVVGEPQDRHRPAALVRVAHAGVHAGQRARVGTAEQGRHDGRPVGGVPVQQFRLRPCGVRARLPDEARQHRVLPQQRGQPGPAA